MTAAGRLLHDPMALFFQILLGNAVLLLLLISIHECGHWAAGRLAGLPAGAMRLRLFSFPQQVVLREQAGGGQVAWVSVADFDRYWSILTRHVPTRRGQFAYVVGGFAAETLAIVLIALGLLSIGRPMEALVATGVSLTMYLVYLLAMDLPQSRAGGRPWGDTTILLSLARGPAIAVASAMVLVRLALAVAILAAWGLLA